MNKKNKIIFSSLVILAVSSLAFFYAVWHDIFWSAVGESLHKDIINKYAGEYKFDPLFIMAIVKEESNFQKHAQSHRGAVGLMQILPSTAIEIAKELNIENFDVGLLRDPEINIRIGFHYLSKLREKYGSDIVSILAAYNAGMQRVSFWKGGSEALSIEQIQYPETRKFVQNIITNYNILKSVRKFKKMVNK